MTKIYILLFIGLINFNKIHAQFEFKPIWEKDVFPNNPYTIQFDQLDRPYFYVANDNGGLRIFKNEASSFPIQIDQLFNSNWAFLKLMDVTQRGNYLYLALGSIFDLFAQDFGIAIVNIENPEAAFVTDYWKSTTPKEGSAVIKVQGNYAFLGAMGAGLHIFNISNPNQIQALNPFLPDIHFPVPNPNVFQEPNARGMAFKDDLIFLCNDAGGIRVIDISTITAPAEINKYINTEFLAETAQAYNNIIIHNNLAYIATDYCGLEIIDVANPMDINQVGIWNPWQCNDAANYWQNSLGHTNQLSFLPAHEGEILIMNGNDSELIALDVSEPSKPILLDVFGETGDSLRTWGLGISEHQIAAAYYTSNAPWISKESKIKLFEWELTTSTNDIPSFEYTVFPNPSTGDLTISFNKKINDRLVIRLINLLGNEIITKELSLNDRSIQLDLSQWNLNGIYFLHSEFGDKQLVKKIVFN